MSLSDLDLPLLPSSDQIRRREFATVRRGYDADQVRDYLIVVAAQVEALEAELHETRADAAEPAPRVGVEPDRIELIRDRTPYEELATRVSTVIETADAEAKRIVDEAEAESKRMLGEARTEADRIRVDAQARAEEAREQAAEALENAKLEAERTLSSLSSRRADLVNHLTEMQSKLLAVAREIDATIEERGRPAADGFGPPTDPEQGDLVTPRDEDVWVSGGAVELPDLASIELEFDEGGSEPEG